ncbi:DNA-protecting protein DprA [Caenimonas koreensis DSM 17982]|uniref:DNA-protecting protein DprA n=1 Tax=Caenimonas koreensis DSM 17982 TaxID=1121255 RepID=A0A844BAU2_9BURK|nr:DNA-processing protein DprA [Caenimonas koreensis]MRD48577.1 DNA-protecting protein DprA [Caenimonas koreensis DSM 17982]
MERDELAAWLRLALAEGVGNGAARKLLAAFGLPKALFAQSQANLSQVLSPAKAQALLTEPAGLADLLEATWQWLEADRTHRRILTLADARYPQALLNTEDPPLMLYVMGQPIDAWPASISMVGSRNPTTQGATTARQFACSFAQAGYTIVSGLALGIDTAAHEGALDAKTPGRIATIAVVGTGLDRVYPKRNLDLAHRIARDGLIISEYPIGTPPLSQNFPKRNRIIAALGQGTLVVEAALQSGSLITARQANEQGKDVFAIPGSIHSVQSRGCHALIKQGAKLVETAQDVLEELSAPGSSRRPAVEPEREDTEPDPVEGDSLLAALGFDPVSLDALVARTGIAASVLQVRLLELEMDGEVTRLAGGLFQRVGQG